MREPKKAEEKPAAVEEAQLIENIRKSMEKDQYYLLCQYAISIVEAKAKIIDVQLHEIWQRNYEWKCSCRNFRRAFMPSS